MLWREGSFPPIILSLSEELYSCGGTVAIPASDASCEDALNGTAVEGLEHARAHTESLQSQMLRLLRCFEHVNRPCEILHRCIPSSIDGDGGMYTS